LRLLSRLGLANKSVSAFLAGYHEKCWLRYKHGTH
jgi:hypothetical protein